MRNLLLRQFIEHALPLVAVDSPLGDLYEY
jgi:hypothetical protein